MVVNPDDTQQLYFYNAPVGGVEFTKVNEADKTESISGITFEIRRVSDDVLVDTVTTGKDGKELLPWRLTTTTSISSRQHLLYLHGPEGGAGPEHHPTVAAERVHHPRI